MIVLWWIGAMFTLGLWAATEIDRSWAKACYWSVILAVVWPFYLGAMIGECVKKEGT